MPLQALVEWKNSNGYFTTRVKHHKVKWSFLLACTLSLQLHPKNEESSIKDWRFQIVKTNTKLPIQSCSPPTETLWTPRCSAVGNFKSWRALFHQQVVFFAPTNLDIFYPRPPRPHTHRPYRDCNKRMWSEIIPDEWGIISRNFLRNKICLVNYLFGEGSLPHPEKYKLCPKIVKKPE